MHAATDPSRAPGPAPYERAQVIAGGAWFLILSGYVLVRQFAPMCELRIAGLPPVSLESVMSALLVILLWVVLIAGLWRGPTRPLLLPQPRREWGFARFKEPADSVRLGQPVPRAAMAFWWFRMGVLAVICAIVTFLFLTGRMR